MQSAPDESNGWYRAIFNQSAFAMSIADTKGHWIAFNPAYPKLFGYSEKELKTMNASELMHPAELKRNITDFKKLVRGQENTLIQERKYIHKNGSIIYGIVHGSVIRDSAGKPKYVVVTIQDITVRKKAENDLIEQQKRLELSQRAGRVGTFEWDLVTGHSDGTREFEALYGVKKGYIGGDLNRWTKFIHPEDRKKITEVTKQTLKQGNSLNTKFRVIWPNKSIHYLQTRAEIERDKSGKALKMRGVTMDITQSELAEEKLQQNEERFRTLIENSSDVVSLVGENGKFLYISPSLKKNLGYTPDELIGKAAKTIFPKEFSKDILKSYMAVASTPGLTETFEHQYVHKDGSIRWLENTTTNLVTHPIIQAYVSNFRDITERKEFEEALQESEAQMRFLAESMPQMIFTAKPNGQIDYFNQRWVEFTGLSNQALEASDLKQLFHPDEADTVWSKWQISLKTGEPYQSEHRLKRFDGEYIWHLCRALPMKDNKGNITTWIGSTTDIDEQKRQEKQKDEFIGIASHELKTPVTSIKAYTQVLKSRFEKNGNILAAAQLTKMDTQLNKLTDLIGDLLDVTKIESGKLRFNLEWFNFDELVTDVVDQIQLTTERHKILNKGQTKSKIFGDRDRVGQVITNFLSNAIKYSPDAKRIIVESSVASGITKLSVQDFGIGMSKKSQENLFERFYRVDSSDNQTFPGLGLGLYISSEIITRLGGQIGVESTKGKGSTFYFTLPIKKRR